MNYQIIKDEEVLKDFIAWLPELENDETYYVALFGRSKYCSTIKGDKAQIKRTTSNKAHLLDKIKQLQCEVDTFKQYGKPIPQEALALYINPNPRSLELAAKKGVLELMKLTQEKYSGYNPYNFMLNFVQKYSKRRLYCNLDFDGVDLDETKEKVKLILNTECLTFLTTRGGFHILVEYDKIDSIYKKTWYNAITKLDGVDVSGDELMPVPGSYQGGFMPIIEKF